VGLGWNAGILYELDKNNRYGLTYRSEVKIDFDGDYKSSILKPVNNLVRRVPPSMGTANQTVPVL
jgi:long-chain fatty acid transport protein